MKLQADDVPLQLKRLVGAGTALRQPYGALGQVEPAEVRLRLGGRDAEFVEAGLDLHPGDDRAELGLSLAWERWLTGELRFESVRSAGPHSLLGIDGKGKPITPVLGWADNRSREQVATLRKKLDERETHQRTGARFHSSFWPAKLLWLKGGNPSGSEGAPWPRVVLG